MAGIRIADRRELIYIQAKIRRRRQLPAGLALASLGGAR